MSSTTFTVCMNSTCEHKSEKLLKVATTINITLYIDETYAQTLLSTIAACENLIATFN